MTPYVLRYNLGYRLHPSCLNNKHVVYRIEYKCPASRSCSLVVSVGLVVFTALVVIIRNMLWIGTLRVFLHVLRQALESCSWSQFSTRRSQSGEFRIDMLSFLAAGACAVSPAPI